MRYYDTDRYGRQWNWVTGVEYGPGPSLTLVLSQFVFHCQVLTQKGLSECKCTSGNCCCDLVMINDPKHTAKATPEFDSTNTKLKYLSLLEQNDFITILSHTAYMNYPNTAVKIKLHNIPVAIKKSSYEIYVSLGGAEVAPQ